MTPSPESVDPEGERLVCHCDGGLVWDPRVDGNVVTCSFSLGALAAGTRLRSTSMTTVAETCPRCGGYVQRQSIPGSATDPRDPLPSDHHFWCSPCGKLWHPVEMPRKGVAVCFDPPPAASVPKEDDRG